ncbi:DUF1549 domain-containing protein, partial [Candidatus Sumerlaeota bacterium]|nr:DUF1549 domain-containing protein [Candidatus Sumerlaeota bacterium]
MGYKLDKMGYRHKQLAPTVWLFCLCVHRLVLAAADKPVDFSRDVRPILQSRCYSCHGPEKQKNGLRLDSREALLAGGDTGPAVTPGKSAESLLILHVTGAGDYAPMPPKGDPLTPEQIELLRAWIDQGAEWPDQDSASKSEKGANHWAFQPLSRPPIPDAHDKSWLKTPIDSFILAELEKKGIKPSPEADQRTLIRRLTYDLHGLPPTPAEVEFFLNDNSPDAYEKLVDRLLASPRYGERWGRHWLDVVHYGETHGFDKDKRRDNAWPYRDYVIKSFNEDKPYARFVREQIAGDVIAPNEPDGIIATGFLAAGPWDFVGHVELREGTMEKARVRALDRDDFLANTVSTFMSLTIQCARCHDHKFDPIPQKEYYRMQAVFAGIDRADRPYEDKEFAAFRARLEERKAGLDKRRGEIETKIKAMRTPELEATQNELDA